jgi:Cysteine-rich secretory protein family
MVARNYWSHNTPDGSPPWVFITAVNYEYQKAGENLAYGFDSSNTTITGWMNSPTHKANLLDTAFKEVGFGVANSESYQSNGQQTIIVAMYASPSSNIATAPKTTATTPPTPSTAPSQTPRAVQQTPSSLQPTPSPSNTPSANRTPDVVAAPQASSPSTAATPSPANYEASKKLEGFSTVSTGEPSEIKLSRLEGFISHNVKIVSLIIVALTASFFVAFCFKHLKAVKKVLHDGESFAIHHPWVDVSLLALVSAAIFLFTKSGTIK